MVERAWISISVCVVSLLITMLISRQGKASLGLPVAYMAGLLLIHVPGAYAYASSGGAFSGLLAGGDYPSVGIQLTAIGTIAFVTGLLAARQACGVNPQKSWAPISIDHRFPAFCLVLGWFLAFGLTPLTRIPSLGAAIVFGSAIWILGVMLGLSRALAKRQVLGLLKWTGALFVYPAVILMYGGFLSLGVASVIAVGSFLLLRFKNTLSALVFGLMGAFIGISIFVTYYEQRVVLRSVVWSGAGIEERVNAVRATFSGFEFFDSNNPLHLGALAARLNQNEFVGLAAERLNSGQVEFLQGRSFIEGVIAVIPRAIWADKPVYGGSPAVVAEMTGLELSMGTSWGVGNVMEFYINYGIWSLIVGFVLLGGLIGWLDIKAYRALVGGRLDNSIVYFIPCVALIQPNGSLVELAGGCAAAVLAAFGCRSVWRVYADRHQARTALTSSRHRRST